MRADFSEKTKDVLGKRVGLVCSNPSCGMLTMGPNSKGTTVTNIGVAAHIIAASVGGPRDVASMPDESRRSIDNGIWLCQSCAKLIDSDVVKYPAQLLREWKANAERNAGAKLNRQMQGSGEDRALLESFEPILENGYYEKQGQGFKIKYFLEGDCLHVEQELENGAVGYYVLDRHGNVLEHKFPYPLSDYTVEIDPSLILKQYDEALSGGARRETVVMKWGKRAILTWDRDHKLVECHFDKGVRMDHVRKTLIVEPPEFTASGKR